MSGKGLVLVTGATGKQGGATARELLGRGVRVRAMTRKPESAGALDLASRGAEIVKGDFDDVSSLRRAVDGAWGVFAVQNTWEAGVEREEEQGKEMARVAHDAGVSHYVYSSVASADRATSIPHFDNKWRVEEVVRSLGFPSHVVLRPVFFMENFASAWFTPGLKEGKLVMAIQPGTTLQMIAVADIGKYGALAFEKADDLKDAALDLAGDAATLPETASVLSEASGRKIEFVQQPIEEVRAWSADYAAMLEWFDRVGYDADITGLERSYGVRPTPLRSWASSVDWNALLA